MKTFDLLGFANHLAALPLAVIHEQHDALERAAQRIEDEAKRSISEYQAAAGPFAAWAPLAPSTVQEKTKLGYAPPDNPELRTGDLRDSIHHRVGLGVMIGTTEAVIGSDEQNMVWQELGTTRMPPRSILGGAAVRETTPIVEDLGSSVVMALCGGIRPIPIR